MLQQTQVERVIPKWQAWLERFPSLADLARATRAEAIRAWQGLGYNMRAVRLHDIALQAVAEFGGELPRTLDGLLRLKGIGRYTAGAIACFAYEQPVAVVDTNIRRVLSRVFGVLPAGVDELAESTLPHDAAYAWNQGLMDLGATLCRTSRPLCLVCPLVQHCRGPGEGRFSIRPAAGEFHGSSRYYRGRLIDTLCALSADETIAVADLIARVAAGAGDEARIAALVRRLAADGLVLVDQLDRARLPD
jgi:A/G-specific adenine glycosylase